MKINKLILYHMSYVPNEQDYIDQTLKSFPFVSKNDLAEYQEYLKKLDKQ
jgi:hypothetical protein